jgi:PTS system mannitol-specific IIC component
MKPALILAAIGGGAAGVFTLLLFNGGLVAAPSPGSIFAVLAMTPRGGFLAVIAGVLAAAVVSFLIASVILKGSKGIDEGDLVKATEKTSELKGKESRASVLVKDEPTEPAKATSVEKSGLEKEVNKIIFACDAGMGSSAMGASILKNKVKKAGLNIEVTNSSISNIPNDADIVITHKDLTDRAKGKLPTATHISVENFLNSPKYDELLEKLK